MNIWFLIWAFILTGAISALLGTLCGKFINWLLDGRKKKKHDEGRSDES